ncbi:2-oxoglutarate dehydrogenase complex dihydrolipoyllysine-residue succinyltransferase [Amycolatopsis ultiminotia]|uniref:Dihydrolipoamide acetyltransferase component of pyruvate dehydrogenase complex n=1 Tax=Amycolatopsis ultiminotia TaxID=543629 RepID=A0ABP6X5U1_9PSEU
MSANITLPQLGVEMTSARLTEWAFEDGAPVSTGDVVAIVETDKVTYEIEAPDDGVLHTEAVVGEEYQVGDRLAVITGVDESYQPHAPDNSGPSTDLGTGRASASAAPGATLAPSTAPPPAEAEELANGTLLATPLARRVATDQGVDLRSVTGSGPRGAIRRRDVEAASARATATTPLPSAPTTEGVPFSPMRRTIAGRMQESLQTTAQMTDVREVDVTALTELRRRLAARSDGLGLTVSFTDLFLKATAMALRAHPELNATVHGDRVVQHDRVHLGLAVSLSEGLVVPVLRDADQLTLRAIHQRSGALATAARQRTVTSEDLDGGTFTVTNIGSYGSHFGTPVLNLPQVAILATGAILDRPVVREGAVVPGKLVHLSLTVDHRVIDGETAGRFHTTLAGLLAEPDTLLVG